MKKNNLEHYDFVCKLKALFTFGVICLFMFKICFFSSQNINRLELRGAPSLKHGSFQNAEFSKCSMTVVLLVTACWCVDVFYRLCTLIMMFILMG